MVPVTGQRGGGASRRLGLLKDLLISLPAAVAYLAGPDLVIEFANDAYREITGRDDLLGRPVGEVFPELVSAGRLAMLRQILRTGEPARGSETELRVVRGGRTEHLFVDYVYQPVRDASGRVAGVLLYASDVTTHVRDRHRLETLTAELSASEERYRTLFKTMPQGVIHYRADGSVLDANPAAARILGLRPEEMTTWPLGTGAGAVHEDGTPIDPADLPAPTALRTGEVVPETLIGLVHPRSGELRWVLITAVPDSLTTAGRCERAYTIFSDVTDQRRTEAALRESTILLGRLRDANVLGVMVATERAILEANDAFLDIIGYQRAEVEAGWVSPEALTPPEWAARDREAQEELRRTGSVQPYDREYLHRDGHRVPVLAGAAVVSPRPLRWVTFVLDLTARQRAEQERTELRIRERTARDEAAQAEERLSMLLRAGSLAAATADRRELLQQVTALVVPSLADYCVVFLAEGDGMLRAAASTHRDPALAAELLTLHDQPFHAAGPMVGQQAYARGEPTLVTDISTEMPGWAESEPGVAGVIARVRAASAVAMPLTVAGQRIGVMVMGRGAERTQFAATDMDVIGELAGRVAATLTVARTFELEHTIAETLQRSLLPALPDIPGLDLASRYLPATTGADVGGDWYDVFRLRGGRVGLVVGDVAGHSVASASVMGQLRSMLRAYAIDVPDPRVTLRRTAAAVTELMPAALATVTCAVLDEESGTFSYASAGHLPPLLAGAEGKVEFLTAASGIMLGAAPDPQLLPGRRLLSPGSTLLLYTDGLVEDRNRDIGEGLATLAGALRGHPGRTAEETCAAAEEALLGSRDRSDDVCLLAVRRPA